MNSTPISALLERKGSVVYAVPATVTITDAVDEMNRHRIGSIVVLDNGRLTGIFTERDVLRRVVGAGVDPKVMRVADVMTGNLITISPETTIEETMILFAEKHCRHLPVLSNGRLIGLISIGDISRWMAEAHRAEAEHLKNYISGGFTA
ncbi:MAG TPA: CBS domain-containing protein [Opitutus sp.]|nr:CBS domain-containing protein [Opitutus sp.]